MSVDKMTCCQKYDNRNMTQYEHEGQTHPKTATLVLKQSLCPLTIDQIAVDENLCRQKDKHVAKKCNKRNMTKLSWRDKHIQI